MRTRLLMTACALTLGTAGVLLSFAPELGLALLGVPASPAALLLVQVVGALYFGFAMLNWMNKDNPTGGIYNRPVVVANLTHFVIAGLAILRLLMDGGQAPGLWAVGAVYTFFAILFAVTLYTHPFPANAEPRKG
ncbi:MAG: hypothetical protein KF701_08155 [Anaerolineales bacterium]|nr:MAG: hypothetical protein KF701_08155 [Anaerolineales bacterium]